MAKLEKKMHLPKISVDDLFSTQEQRDSIGTIRNISIEHIEDFKNHPFKVRHDESLDKMIESIKEMGVLNPVIVRPLENGKFEMVSGHRRKFASKLANNQEVPAIVKELSDDEAVILMVDSNIQREEILPSEKAFAYKMKLEAIKHQGKRADLTCVPLAHKLEGKKSREIVAENTGESVDQIRRYIRLTELIPELRDKVDAKEIAFRPAVELSYLSIENQKDLVDIIDCMQATPSLSQAIQFKKLEQAGTLDVDVMDDILSVEKPNQIERVHFNKERLKSVLPEDLKLSETEDYVVKALEFYKHYQRVQSRKKEDRER